MKTPEELWRDNLLYTTDHPVIFYLESFITKLLRFSYWNKCQSNCQNMTIACGLTRGGFY